MTMSSNQKPTACLVLADGSIFYGHGVGAIGTTVAELCFNTAMTGYQEIMTDPSYAGQIVTFTFPHIGNTGTTAEDDETTDPFAAGNFSQQPAYGQAPPYGQQPPPYGQAPPYGQQPPRNTNTNPFAN